MIEAIITLILAYAVSILVDLLFKERFRKWWEKMGGRW
jgi:hypothetical protein